MIGVNMKLFLLPHLPIHIEILSTAMLVSYWLLMITDDYLVKTMSPQARRVVKRCSATGL